MKVYYNCDKRIEGYTFIQKSHKWLLNMDNPDELNMFQAVAIQFVMHHC